MSIEYNADTKNIVFASDYMAALDESDRTRAEETSDLVNRLLKDLTAVQGEFPPPPNQASAVSNTSSGLIAAGVKLLAKKNFEGAQKNLTTALTAVLRRPLWESTQKFFEDVAQCLAPLCDANIGLKNYAEAYSEVSLLLLLRPLDPANHFRKGLLLESAWHEDDAKQCYLTAASLSPQNETYLTALKRVKGPDQ